MYYSVTQVCRCNEETRTNSSETSLTGQPLYDTSTNELYIGDGETTIQNLSPIQNLKAGSGMTYTNGSVSLNEGTQTNAGGIKVWAENNDVYYSTPLNNASNLIPIERVWHEGYNQPHPNYHSLSGTASNQYDTGDRTPHHKDINITLNYKGTTSGSGTATGYATGAIHCNKYTVLQRRTINGYSELFVSIQDNTTKHYSRKVYFDEKLPWIDGTVAEGTDVRFESLQSSLLINHVTTSVSEDSDGYVDVSVGFYIEVKGQEPIGNGYTVQIYSDIGYPTLYGYRGVDSYGVVGRENVVISGEPTYQHPIGVNVLSIDSKYVSNTEEIRTEAVADVNGATVVYNTPFTYTPDGYLYEGTATPNIGDDAKNVQISPSSPSGMTANVNYSGNIATINASYTSPENEGDSIPGSVALSYNTPIYGYYLNEDTYIGSDYNARVTHTSPSVTNYTSGTNGSYFWVNMKAASPTDVSANVTSYYDVPIPGYNSYHYPIELNGVRYNFNTIDLDGVDYAATAEKYNER